MSSTNRRTDFDQAEFSRLVSGMRSYLNRLARNRVSETVSADDAHTYLDRNRVSTSPTVRLRFINSVLRTPQFSYAGVTTSSRPVAKGRTITLWTR
jgi:hypothetical protein